MGAKEMLELISKQWATVKDIMKIGHCGLNTAQSVKKEIVEKIKVEQGKEVPWAVVPMAEVVKYYDININYLKRVIISKTKSEKDIENK